MDRGAGFGQRRGSSSNANASRPSQQQSASVNRRLRDEFSPPRSRSPTQSDDSRRRSRSPFRGNNWLRESNWSARDGGGRSARPRDPRYHGVHYEGASTRDDRRTTFDDDLYGRDPKRRRTRSRSPAGRNGTQHDRGDSPRNGHAGFVRESKAQSQEASRSSREISSNTTIPSSLSSGKPKHDPSSQRGTNDTDSAQSVRDEPVPPAVSEVSIEERRKRREAILAKHGRQEPSLLVQAISSSSAATPTSPSSPQAQAGTPASILARSLSPDISTAGTPRTPQFGTPEPVVVTDDTQLVKTPTAGMGGGADEPSAADYDPSMDRQEDQRRQSEVQLAADQTDPRDRDTVMKDAVESKEVTDDKDMDASDDEEDDMFADNMTITNIKNIKIKPMKAVQLDQSLLDNWDDDHGYYRIILGELIDHRYQVKEYLGKGVFASVFRALDMNTDQLVAIKVIRANDSMIKAAAKELAILRKLNEEDPDDKKHCVRLDRSFNHKGHLCIVFENLSMNLREVLKKFGRNVGLNIKAIRAYAQQMFLALGYLRKCNLIHADLKPDNILVSEERSKLKVCDFGSAADADDAEIAPYLVSRYYRAPEIILGITPDYAIDMWAIGCTLFEIYTGKILFNGANNNQMLRSIMECRGKLPAKLIKKGELGENHFDPMYSTFRSLEEDKLTRRPLVRLLNFGHPTRDLKTRVFEAAGKNPTEAEIKELNLFVDLLDKMLALNPERRITPNDALKHPFINRVAAPPTTPGKTKV